MCLSGYESTEGGWTDRFHKSALGTHMCQAPAPAPTPASACRTDGIWYSPLGSRTVETVEGR